MSEITRATAKAIGNDVRDALAAVAEKHGLKVEVNGGSYDDSSFSPRVKFSTDDAEANRWRLYARSYDLEEEWFGRTFKSNGRTFTISGINTKAPKYPVNATTDDGRTFKFTSRAVRTHLSAANKAR